MADPKLDALILQLSGMRTLLLKQAGTNVKKRNSIIENFERTITGLKEEKERATTEKQKVEFYNKVEGMAKGFQGMTEAALALKNAVEGGDPFAISASSLDLAASLVATVSMAGGPIGAAVGAALGAILSLVSTILKIFQKETESLVSQIEQMMRNLKLEDQIKDLRTAQDDISAFTDLAIKINQRNVEGAENALAENRTYTPETRTYSFIHGELNNNTITFLLGAKNWMDWLNGNKELPLWGEVLALFCQSYISFKLGVASWLPLVAPDPLRPTDDPIQLMIDWRDKFDSVVLASLEQIKPAVRNRGIICHAGTGGIYVRDVVITNKKDSWTKFKGKAHAIAAAYEPGWEASPHPDLSILHLGGEQKFEHPEPAVPTAMSAIYHQSPLSFRHWDFETFQKVFLNSEYESFRVKLEQSLLHPFTKKTAAYNMSGEWPVRGNWDKINDWDIEELYDICAIPGPSPGEINVYTARTNDYNIRGYTKKGSILHVKTTTSYGLPGYTAGAVRAIRTRMTKPEVVPENWNVVIYGLCEHDDVSGHYPFEIQVSFSSGPWSRPVMPPRPFPEPAGRDWRNFPVGIAVDTDRLWVFGTSFIACATHAAVDKSIREKPEKGTPAEVDWALYTMPSLLGYDPSKRVYMGLRDLCACDDGTLTAVIEEDQTRYGRIFTAAPQFEGGKLVIKDWIRDPDGGTNALRVHKLPIFCWPIFEGLANALNVEETEALLRRRTTEALASPAN